MMDRRPVNESEDDTRDGLCAVCLQTLMHPVGLECGHVFCFLCVKGVALQGMIRTAPNARAQAPQPACPMCRAPIQPQVLNNPNLLEDTSRLPISLPASVDQPTKEDDQVADQSPPPVSHWYYQGRNGWWQYDQRTEVELERAFQLFIQEQEPQTSDLPPQPTSLNQSGGSDDQHNTSAEGGGEPPHDNHQTCELLIAGFLYTIDFEQMVQHRTNEPHRRRKVKRDLVQNLDGQYKGVAGIRCQDDSNDSSGAVAAASDAPVTSDVVDTLTQSLDRAVTLNDEDEDEGQERAG